MFNKVRETLLNNKERGISFDSKLGDADFKNLTGLDKVSFNDILTYLTSVRDTQVRSARTCFGIFMTKLKTAISNKVLSTLFSVSKDSKLKLIPLSLLFKRVSRTLLNISTISVLLKSVFGLQFDIICIA
jgi:hypothetical protein